MVYQILISHLIVFIQVGLRIDCNMKVDEPFSWQQQQQQLSGLAGALIVLDQFDLCEIMLVTVDWVKQGVNSHCKQLPLLL